MNGNATHVTRREQIILTLLSEGKFTTQMPELKMNPNCIQRILERLIKRMGGRTQAQLLYWWGRDPQIRRKVSMQCEKCGETKSVPDSLVIIRPGGTQVRLLLCRGCSNRVVAFCKALIEGVNLNAHLSNDNNRNGSVQVDSDGIGTVIEENGKSV